MSSGNGQAGRPAGMPGAEAFIEEAGELLEQLEHGLLALEGCAPGSQAETVDEIFRALHTIKGSGAMFGFGALADMTHHFEDAFDRVRGGTLSVDRHLIDLSLAARDKMVGLLEVGPGDAAPTHLAVAIDELIAAVQDHMDAGGGEGVVAEAPTTAPTPAQTPADARHRYHIHFKPAAGSLLGGMRPDLLVEELCSLGQAEASIDASAVPGLDHLDPTSCYLAWEIVLTTEESRKTVEGVFIFADDADLTIEEVRAAAAPPSTCTPDTPLHDQPRPAPLSSDASAADPTEAAIGPGFQSPRGDVAPPTPGSRQGQQGEHVRVQARRLDDLMDQLGELVIAQSRLQALAADLGDSALSHLVEEIERLTGGMRDTTLSLRMLPIETVFGKFRRIVRDLSASLGKDVSLVTRGGETEIDKTVIDRLTEPLVHMIRNAMDHGIENAQTRRAQGKSEGGTITLSAWQEGGNVLIAMEDDGKGLDTDAIRRRAEDRGLIQPGAEMSEAALHALIFAPGFSTAASLSSVSGRGVGMDAVRTAVDVLRGKIAIDSTRGRGTRITLALPVSLAIIDSFLVTLAGQVYVLPLSAVEECVEYDAAVGTAAPDCADTDRADTGRRLIELRERLIPYIDLRALFRAGGERPAGQRIVIVRSDGALIGLVVDDILGQAQTVIKALAPVHRAVGGFSGATILGDGTVALILDVVALAARAQSMTHGSASPRTHRQIAAMEGVA